MIKPSHALPQRSASEVFTDREDARARFSRALDEAQPVDAYRVLVWYGVGGQGKTALQAEFGRMIDRARGHWVNVKNRRLASALIDLENPANRNPAQALLSLRLQLAEHGALRFPAFDLAFARYFSLDQPGKDIRAVHPELFRHGSEILGDVLTVASDVANVIPGYGLLAKYGSKLAARGAESLYGWWNRRGRSILAGLDEMSVDQLAGALPKYLGHDLCEAMAAPDGPRVVIRFDTHEALWRDRGLKDGPGALLVDDWLRRLVQDTPGAVVVVTGRDRLRWDEIDRGWAEVFEQHLLGGLSDEDADAFLVKVGVDNPDIRARMIAAARGDDGEGCLPYYLDLERETHDALVVAGVAPVPDQFGGDRAEILARFLAHLDPETERRLRLASYPETLDPASLATLSTQFLKEADNEGWKRLLDRAFVERPAEGPPTLHALTRATLQESERTEHWERFRDIHLWFWQEAEGGMSRPDQPVTADDERLFLTAISHMVALGSVRSLQWASERFERFSKAARSRTVETAASRLMPFARQHFGATSVGALLSWQADAAAELGRAHQAEALLREAVDIYAEHQGPDAPQTFGFMGQLAIVLDNQGRHGEAEALYERVLAHQTATLGAEDPATSTTLNNLAMVYQNQGRFGLAAELLEKVLRIRLAEYGLDHRHTGLIQANLALVWVEIGALDEAEALIKPSLETLERTLGVDHPHYWHGKFVEGRIALGRRRFDRAEVLYGAVMEALTALWGPAHLHVIRARAWLARLALDSGRPVEARDEIERVLGLVECLTDRPKAESSWILIDRAEIDLALGETDRPAKDLVRARADLADLMAPDHPGWSDVELVEAKLDLARGRDDQARERLDSAARRLVQAGVRPSAYRFAKILELMGAEHKRPKAP